MSPCVGSTKNRRHVCIIITAVVSRGERGAAAGLLCFCFDMLLAEQAPEHTCKLRGRGSQGEVRAQQSDQQDRQSARDRPRDWSQWRKQRLGGMCREADS